MANGLLLEMKVSDEEAARIIDATGNFQLFWEFTSTFPFNQSDMEKLSQLVNEQISRRVGVPPGQITHNITIGVEGGYTDNNRILRATISYKDRTGAQIVRAGFSRGEGKPPKLRSKEYKPMVELVQEASQNFGLKINDLGSNPYVTRLGEGTAREIIGYQASIAAICKEICKR